MDRKTESGKGSVGIMWKTNFFFYVFQENYCFRNIYLVNSLQEIVHESISIKKWLPSELSNLGGKEKGNI